jgi:hypothetical protein
MLFTDLNLDKEAYEGFKQSNLFITIWLSAFFVLLSTGIVCLFNERES